MRGCMPWPRLTTCCWCTNCSSSEPRQSSRALPIPPEEGEEYLSIAPDWRSNTERPVQGLSEQQRSIGRDSRSSVISPKLYRVFDLQLRAVFYSRMFRRLLENRYVCGRDLVGAGFS